MNLAAKEATLGTRLPRPAAGHSPNLKKVLDSTPSIATKVEEEGMGRRTKRDRRTIAPGEKS